MSGVLLVLLIVAVAVLAWWSRPVDAELDDATYRAAAELHAIRRRLDVASLKTDLRADAALMRRELRDELAAADEQQRLVKRTGKERS